MGFVSVYVKIVTKIWPLIILFWLGLLIFGCLRGFRLIEYTDNMVPATKGTPSYISNHLLAKYFDDGLFAPWLFVLQCPATTNKTSFIPNGGCLGENDINYPILDNSSSILFSHLTKHLLTSHPDVFDKTSVESYFLMNNTQLDELKTQYVSNDGLTTFFSVQVYLNVSQSLRFDAYNTFQDIQHTYLHTYCPNCEYIGVASTDALMNDVNTGIEKLLIKTNMFILPISGSLVLYMVGNWRLLLITLFNVGVVVLGAFAISDILSDLWHSRPQSITPQMIEVISTAISIDYSLFIFTRFVKELEIKKKRFSLRRYRWNIFSKLLQQQRQQQQHDQHSHNHYNQASRTQPLSQTSIASAEHIRTSPPSSSSLSTSVVHTSTSQSDMPDSIFSSSSSLFSSSTCPDQFFGLPFDPSVDSLHDPYPDCPTPSYTILLSSLVATLEHSGHVVLVSGLTLLLSFGGFIISQCTFLIKPAMFTAIGVFLAIATSLTSTAAFIIAWPSFFADMNILPSCLYCCCCRRSREIMLFDSESKNTEIFVEAIDHTWGISYQFPHMNDIQGAYIDTNTGLLSYTPITTQSKMNNSTPYSAPTDSGLLLSPLHLDETSVHAYLRDNAVIQGNQGYHGSQTYTQQKGQNMQNVQNIQNVQKMPQNNATETKNSINEPLLDGYKNDDSDTIDIIDKEHQQLFSSSSSSAITVSEKSENDMMNTNSMININKFKQSFWYHLGYWTVKFPSNFLILLFVFSIMGYFTWHLFSLRLSSAYELGIPRTSDALVATNILSQAFVPGLLQPMYLLMRFSPNTDMPSPGPAFSKIMLDSGNEFLNLFVQTTGITPNYTVSPFFWGGSYVDSIERAQNLLLTDTSYQAIWSQSVSPYTPTSSPSNETVVFKILVNSPVMITSPKMVELLHLIRSNVTEPLTRQHNNTDEGVIDYFLSTYKATEEDTVNTNEETFPLMLSLTFAVVIIVVAVLLQSAFVPIRLLLTLILPLGSTFGLAVLVYQHGILKWTKLDMFTPQLDSIYWELPPFAAVVLLSLALDYDIFLILRVIEHRTNGYTNESSILLALYDTGSIINAAGLIMASTFAGLLLMPSEAVNQLGWILVSSVLIDTFVVRPIIVPCVMSWGDAISWWPRKVPQQNLKHFDGTIDLQTVTTIVD